jgi:hypothetical protein
MEADRRGKEVSMLRACVWLQLAMSDGLRQVRQNWGLRTAAQMGDERGQTTAEHALVILAAAAIAIVLIAWARCRASCRRSSITSSMR